MQNVSAQISPAKGASLKPARTLLLKIGAINAEIKRITLELKQNGWIP
jgi:hypothetical protein